MKKIYFLIILISSLMASINVLAESDCKIKADKLGAEYVIQVIDLKSSQVKKQQKLMLWRDNNRVIHVDQELAIAEIWELTKNQQVKPIRYFDEYQRGIEYQPEDIATDHKKIWNKKYQLIDISDLSKTSEDKTASNNQAEKPCDAIQHYANDSIKLAWLSHYQLPKQIEKNQGNLKIKWQLKNIIDDKQKIKQAFAQREHYYLTDYVDIGDNESDPFLVKMMNLGFVEHADKHQHKH